MLKTLDISKWTIFWKWLWGGKEAIFDYLLDKGNTAVALIPAATKAQLARIYEAVKRVRARIDKLSWLCPWAWRPYYNAILRCTDAVIAALADAQISREELNRIVAQFQSAYALWRAEDVELPPAEETPQISAGSDTHG